MMPLLLTSVLLLAACGDEDPAVGASTEDASTEDDAAEEAQEDEAADGDDDATDAEDAEDTEETADAEEQAAAVPATVSLDGTELEPLADTLQCVAFPDGTERILLEVGDPGAGAEDPEARMSLVVERTEDEATVRIASGLDLADEVNGEWAASPEDAAAVDIDGEQGTAATDVPLELRELNYDGDPGPEQRSLTFDIDCS